MSNLVELSEKLARAIESMEVVYKNVTQIFDSPDKGEFGVSEEVLHALMLGAFDLRNGLRLCAMIDKGFCSDGMDNGESGKPDGCGSEGSGCGSGNCCDCPEWGECVGSDLCCKEAG
jgi:hypothetical protein